MKGGEKLQRYMRDMSKKVRDPGTLRVGFFENATYPDGTFVAYVAAIQNWGATLSNGAAIPPRPFFSNMVKDKKGEWPDQVTKLAKANDFDLKASLMLMGQVIRDELVQSIIDTNEPPLSPVTIAKKGFDKPLIDTSHMMNSAAFDVVDKDEPSK